MNPLDNNHVTHIARTWLPQRPLVIMIILMILSWVPFVVSKIVAARSASPSNIKSTVDEWVDNFHLGRRLLAGDLVPPDSIFAMEISIDKERAVTIVQSRSQPEYLIVEDGAMLADATNKAFEKLTPSQRAQVKDDIIVALAQLHMGQAITFSPLTIKIVKMLPITGSLSELDFISALLDTDTATMAVMSTVASSMRRYQPSLPDISIVGRIVKQISQ